MFREFPTKSSKIDSALRIHVIFSRLGVLRNVGFVGRFDGLADQRVENNRSLREREGCRETIEDVTPSSVEATHIKLETTPDGKLPKDRWIIGYHADCDFRIDWKTVSGIHCQLTLHGGHLHVSDLNSTNGTFINRVRIQDRAAIRTIDLLTLGRDHRVILPRDLLVDSDDGKYVLFIGQTIIGFTDSLII